MLIDLVCDPPEHVEIMQFFGFTEMTLGALPQHCVKPVGPGHVRPDAKEHPGVRRKGRGRAGRGGAGRDNP